MNFNLPRNSLIVLILLTAVGANCDLKQKLQPSSEAVVSYHLLATQIGNQILANGGNAFDAFVATTAAQYVLSEGVTSLGGPLGALVYDAKSKQVLYLDAGFNSPLDPTGHFNPNHPETTAGAATFVPGAPAGLEAISRRFGTLPFKDVLQPAIMLAREGFVVNHLMAGDSTYYNRALIRSEYGRNTYFPNGKPLVVGQEIKLPTFADTLDKLAQFGADYMYSGDWADKAVRQIRAAGGRLTKEDFLRYRVQWRAPLMINYRGTKIYAPSGKTYGGLTTLFALKALENASFSGARHFSQDGLQLEMITRAEDWAEAYTHFYAHQNNGETIDDQALVQSAIETDAKAIWQRVKAHLSPERLSEDGTHSYHVTVIDRDGNAITGTNTIEALPWAQGIFVDGVALTDSGMLGDQTLPGKRNLMPLSMHIGIDGSNVSFAVGAFGASLIPAELQYVINAVDYKLSAHDAMTNPRFGINGIDLTSPGYPPSGKGRWLDRRVDYQVAAIAESLGLKFDQDGSTVHGHEHYMDLGLGSMAIVNPDGTVDGAIAPLAIQCSVQ